MTKEEMIHLLRTNRHGWNIWRRGEGMQSVELIGAQLQRLDLREADLRKARLIGADLSGSDLTDAQFEDAELMGAKLDKAELMGANLRGAKLNGANLTKANLNATELTGADLTGASLLGAHLLSTRFSGTSLRKAVLMFADFRNVDLADSDFTGAVAGHSSFDDANLSRAKGLDAIEHRAGSSVGIDSIYRSQGTISERFLRNAGTPEEFIHFIPSLISAQAGSQFYSCFISYSHKDEVFAQRLHEQMLTANLRVFYAPEDMKGGEKLHEQIEAAIRVYDKLLIVLSEASLASEWVKTEIRKGLREQKETGKRKLFPVRLVDFEEHIRNWSSFDADTGKDLGVELREYHMPDFTQWKDHDKFKTAFKRLLRDLKPDALPPSA